MTISQTVRDWIIGPVVLKLDALQKEIHTMVVTQAQLDAALTALGTAVTNEDSLISKIVAEVAALIAKASAAGVDLTTEQTAINSMAADIGTQATAIQAAITSASGTTDS
jgi:hypothetical protein